MSPGADTFFFDADRLGYLVLRHTRQESDPRIAKLAGAPTLRLRPSKDANQHEYRHPGLFTPDL